MTEALSQRWQRTRQLVQVGWWSFIVAMLAAGAVLIVASSVPPDHWKAYLDRLANRGDSHLSRETIGQICRQVRLAGAVVVALAFVAMAVRRRAVKWLSPVAAETVTSGRAFVSGLADEIRGAGTIALVALAILSVGAVWLRLQFIHIPMRIDESATYLYYANKPVFVGLSNYAAPNNHVLHTLLAHISISMFGHDPWAIRLPAMIAGVLLVPLTFLVALRAAGSRVAIMATALVAASSYLVDYSTSARGYTIQAALLLMALLFGQELARRRSLAAIVGLVVVSALGFFTVPTMLYGLATVLLWVLCEATYRQGRGVVMSYLRMLAVVGAVTLVLAGVLYLPVVVVCGPGAVLSNAYVQPIPLAELLPRMGRMVRSTLGLWLRDLPVFVAWLLALAGAAGLVVPLLTRRSPQDRVPIAAAAVVACGLCLIAQRVTPYERCWIMLIPVASITIATGLGWLLDRFSGAESERCLAALTLSMALGACWASGTLHSRSIIASDESWTLPGAPAVVNYALSHRQRGDQIRLSGNMWMIVMYYVLRGGGDITYLYVDPHPITGRVLVLQYEPRVPLKESLAFIRRANPELAEPVLLATFDGANLYEVTPKSTVDNSR